MPAGTQSDAVPGRLEERPQIPCSEECLLRPGNTNCGGCGMSVGLTMLGRALADGRGFHVRSGARIRERHGERARSE
jgi:hypothetical protein